MISTQFLRFAAVGAAGFFVDAATLSVLLATGVNVYISRIFSFLCAVTFTWLYNRRYTFLSAAACRPSVGEWGRFTLVSSSGGAVNMVLYVILVSWGDPFAQFPILALAIGSAAGLCLNFLGSRLFVFNRKKSRCTNN
ncbi:GtrA family protein [Microvirga tunisiensis]|uniref:GtrA family protein n=1 Tax=Microvirga tunisiensis TaxID=2108360 RepID=UPI003B84911C